MTEPYTTVLLVSPGGLVTKPFADGTHLTMRCTAGYLHSETDGLLVEMAERREPVPWENQRVRDEAMRAVRDRKDLEDEETRQALLAWIEGTPYYD